MEQRISVVTLGVAELARSRQFYEGLGWQPSFASDEVVFFQLNGLVLALYPQPDMLRDAGLSTAAPGGPHVMLAYNVRSRDEVDAVLARARATGATMLKPGQDAVWGGYTGYFADHDGHLWEVAWNPAWLLGDDGDTTFRP